MKKWSFPLLLTLAVTAPIHAEDNTSKTSEMTLEQKLLNIDQYIYRPYLKRAKVAPEVSDHFLSHALIKNQLKGEVSEHEELNSDFSVSIELEQNLGNGANTSSQILLQGFQFISDSARDYLEVVAREVSFVDHYASTDPDVLTRLGEIQTEIADLAQQLEENPDDQDLQYQLGQLQGEQQGYIDRFHSETGADGSTLGYVSLVHDPDKLAEIANNGGSTYNPSTIRTAAYLFSLMADPQNADLYLSNAKESLNTAEKLELIRLFDNYAYGSSAYNASRPDDTNIIVPKESLLAAMTSGKSFLGGNTYDIELAKASLGKSLGFDQSYVITHKTHGGKAAKTLFIDPDDSARAYSLSTGAQGYNRLITTNTKGSAILDNSLNAPQSGIFYDVYDSDGNFLSRETSEHGKILQDVTNFQKISPLETSTYSLKKARISSHGVNATSFAGTTSSGETVSGLAVSSAYSSAILNDQAIAYIQGGVAYGVSERDFSDKTAHHLYSQVTTGISTKAIKVTSFKLTSDSKERELYAVLSAEASGEIYYGNSVSPYNGESYGTFDNNFVSNIQATLGAPLTDNLDVTLTLRQDFGVGQRNLVSSEYANLATQTVVNAGLLYEFDSGAEIYANVGRAMNNYGGTTYAEAGYKDKYFNVSTNFQWADDNMPQFIAGGYDKETYSLENKQEVFGGKAIFNYGADYVRVKDPNGDQHNGFLKIGLKF